MEEKYELLSVVLKKLQDYKFNMTHKGISIWLPEPEAYTLHKVLIHSKRKDPAKKEKNLMAFIYQEYFSTLP